MYNSQQFFADCSWPLAAVELSSRRPSCGAISRHDEESGELAIR